MIKSFQFCLVQGSCLPSKPPCLLLHFSGHFFLTTLKETKSLANFNKEFFFRQTNIQVDVVSFNKHCAALPWYQIQTPYRNLIQVAGFNRIQDAALLFPIQRTSHDKWPPCCLDLQTPKTSGQLGGRRLVTWKKRSDKEPLKMSEQNIMNKKIWSLWSWHIHQIIIRSRNSTYVLYAVDVCCATGWRLRFESGPLSLKLTVLHNSKPWMVSSFHWARFVKLTGDSLVEKQRHTSLNGMRNILRDVGSM